MAMTNHSQPCADPDAMPAKNAPILHPKASLAPTPINSPPIAAASIWRQVRAKHMASIEYHVRPRLPLPVEELDDSIQVEPPALIKPNR